MMVFKLQHWQGRRAYLYVLLVVVFTIMALIITPYEVTAMANDYDNNASDASEVSESILVYDNRSRDLRITEISFTIDFLTMTVVVENTVTGIVFSIEHDVDPEDTVSRFIDITATDGLGSRSETVQIANPFWIQELYEIPEEPEPISGSLSVEGTNVKNEYPVLEGADNEASIAIR